MVLLYRHSLNLWLSKTHLLRIFTTESIFMFILTMTDLYFERSHPSILNASHKASSHPSMYYEYLESLHLIINKKPEGNKSGFFFKILFIHERHRERERHRQRKKLSLCWEPDAGLDPRTWGSQPCQREMLNH